MIRMSPGHEIVFSPGNDFSVGILRNATKSYVTGLRSAFRTLFNSEILVKDLVGSFSQSYIIDLRNVFSFCNDPVSHSADDGAFQFSEQQCGRLERMIPRTPQNRFTRPEFGTRTCF
jgi:hypothetical protein